MFYYRPHTEYDGKVMSCVSVLRGPPCPEWGGGLSRVGGPPSRVSRSGGPPGQGPGLGPPRSRSRGAPRSRSRGPPRSRSGGPPGQGPGLGPPGQGQGPGAPQVKVQVKVWGAQVKVQGPPRSRSGGPPAVKVQVKVGMRGRYASCGHAGGLSCFCIF